MIGYTDDVSGIAPSMLEGFFEGWPNPPSPQRHLDILRGSSHAWVALDEGTGRVVGFITAVSDGVLSAYIPLLEVLPEYRGRRIGRQLVQRMLATLRGLYMVDLLCDADMKGFYERFGMIAGTGMLLRNYDRQAGA